jgi:hypothetical protein
VFLTTCTDVAGEKNTYPNKITVGDVPKTLFIRVVNRANITTEQKDNPGLLRIPLIIDEKRLQVGYNEEEIRKFLPRKYRLFQLLEAKRMNN